MTSIIYYFRERKLQADSSTNFRLMWRNGISRCPAVPYSRSTLQGLSRVTRWYAFSRSAKHTKTSFAYSQDSQSIVSKVKFWPVVLQSGQKPHWPSSNFDSTISRHFIYLRHLAFGIHFSWKAKKWYFSIIHTIFTITFLVCRNDHTCLPVF